MDYTLSRIIYKLPKTNTELTKHNVSRIKSEFPIAKEHTILWADVKFGRRLSGIVLTDIGIFIKGSKTIIDENNKSVKEEEEKVDSIYHYIRWEYFSPYDFEIIEYEDSIKVIFNGKPVLDTPNAGVFINTYSNEYENIIKESAVSASDVFADFEAVIPENFAAINTKHGHGEMAEEALNLIDKLEGNDARVLGRNNEKNGPDRVVNNQFIQTKYHTTGKRCIDDCFDKATGEFRYLMQNGEPMMIEVPKDEYAEAINEFRNRILEGKVPGVTNPNDASKYIKAGKLTYKQALNLCKPGTIESLSYDAVTGVVNCSFTFGLTFLSTFIICYAQTGDRKEAMSAAFSASIQVFGLAFFAHMFTQQVARTSLTKQLIPLSTYVVHAMGPKVVQPIVNAIRSMMGKTAISGAAAMRQLAKILRSNLLTSAITFVVFSVPDTLNIFKKRVSSAQYTKNMLSLIGTMATAGGGTLAASLAAAKVGAAIGTPIAPGVGTAVGIAGGVVGGLVGGTVIKIAGDAIAEDDTVKLSRMFNGVVINLIYEYMLSESEIDCLIEKLDNVKPKFFRSLFADTLASDNQEKVIEDFIRHYYEEIIRRRSRISIPGPSDLICLIEEISKENASIA